MASANPIHTLSVEEIVRFFKQNAPELAVGDSSLKTPSCEGVTLIYRWLLKSITDCQDASLVQGTFSRDQLFEYPELHSISLPLFTLTLAVGSSDIVDEKLCHLGVHYSESRLHRILEEFATEVSHEFNMMCFTTPTPKRTTKFVGILICVLKFINPRRVVVEEIRQASYSIRDQRQFLELENEKTLARINRLRVDELEHEPLVRQLEGETEDVRNKMQKLLKKKAAMEKDNDIMQSDTKALTLKLDALETEKERLKNEDERLKQQIISSPKKFATDVKSLEKKRQELQKELQRFRGNYSSFQQKRSGIPRVTDLVRSLLAALDDIVQVKDNERSELVIQTKCIEEVEQLGQSCSEAKFKVDLQRQQLETAQGIMAKIRSQNASRISELQAKIGAYRQRVESLSSAYSEEERISNDMRTAYENMQKELAEQTKKFDSGMKQLESLALELLKMAMTTTEATTQEWDNVAQHCTHLLEDLNKHDTEAN